MEGNLDPCPVTEAIKIISGKWRLQIIHVIGSETRRFGELKRLIPAISEKMLIQELKKLVELKLVHRKAYKEIPPKVEYSITALGKEIFPIIEQIKVFGLKRLEINLE
ncbi:MAG: helix-turn-helix transcriptional regulator [Aureispira sp.]|nr:helix-turn-helix transcriptional regulator [Aureispira sp.]